MRTGRALLVLVVASLLGCPLSAQGPAWPTYQANNRHDGYLEIELDPATFQPRWTIQLSGLNLNPVAAADSKIFATVAVYFVDEPQLFAVAADTGQVLWDKGFGSLYSVNPPAYSQGKIYLQTGKGVQGQDALLHAFDATTGAFAFQQSFLAQWSRYFAPTVDGDTVYVDCGMYEGLCAFAADEPLLRWFAELHQYDQWTPALDENLVYAYTGAQYVDPAGPARLAVVRRADGFEVYSIFDPNFDWSGWSLGCAPVLGAENDVLIIQGGRLVSFDLATHLIRFEETSLNYEGQPSVAHGRVFALGSGKLSVRDETTGELDWEWLSPEPLLGTILVTDSHVFVRSDERTYAIDLGSHESTWSIAQSGHLAWSEGALLIAGRVGMLTAIDAPAILFRDGFETGDTSQWTLTTG